MPSCLIDQESYRKANNDSLNEQQDKDNGQANDGDSKYPHENEILGILLHAVEKHLA